jgi:hypothetical protein
MPTVHNLHQPLFGYRPCTASHSLRRHDQRRDRLDSDLLLVPLASDFLIEVSLDPLAPRLANAYTIGARRAQLVHASRPLNESINANYYYFISNSSSSFKNQKLDLCSPSGSTSASNPEASFVFHSLSHKALLPQAITPQTRQQGSLHVLTPKERPHRGRHRPQDREICNGSTPSRRRRRLPSMAHFGKLLLLLGANHVQIGHDFQPGYVFGQRKLLNLWNFERHRSHATRDRKRTAHVSTSIIERVSHRIRRLLSARVCRLLNVCLRRLSIGSESHLTVA